MNRIILADDQPIFRAGVAKVLSAHADIRVIAQCDGLNRLNLAIETYPGAIVVFASDLKPDLSDLAARIRVAGSVGIVIAEPSESALQYTRLGLRGVVYRSSTSTALTECVRKVARGLVWVERQTAAIQSNQDLVGARVRDRLNTKEMQIVSLIAKGCRNREIATHLSTSEQVVKNHVRRIFDKVGVSDRLELALFIAHHAELAQAAAEAGKQLMALASAPLASEASVMTNMPLSIANEKAVQYGAMSVAV